MSFRTFPAVEVNLVEGLLQRAIRLHSWGMVCASLAFDAFWDLFLHDSTCQKITLKLYAAVTQVMEMIIQSSSPSLEHLNQHASQIRFWKSSTVVRMTRDALLHQNSRLVLAKWEVCMLRIHRSRTAAVVLHWSMGYLKDFLRNCSLMLGAMVDVRKSATSYSILETFWRNCRRDYRLP